MKDFLEDQILFWLFRKELDYSQISLSNNISKFVDFISGNFI